MIKMILTISCIVTMLIANAQSAKLEWLKKRGKNNNYSSGNSIALDKSGNIIYSAGIDGNGLISKLDADGKFLWEISFFGAWGFAIVIDSSDNI